MLKDTIDTKTVRGEGPTLEVADVGADAAEVATPLYTSRGLAVMDDIDRRVFQDLSDLVGAGPADALWASLDHGQSRRWVGYAFVLARLSCGGGDAFDRAAYNKAIALLAIVAAGAAGGK
jgi:hypothetical protein